MSDPEDASGVCVVVAPVSDIDGFPIAGLGVAASVWQTSFQQFEITPSPPRSRPR
ncbi:MULTISPECIES: hypothetical protein [unclassified Janthinobacterium]|uniref:hypothetical protein n=1 Tax=unclassified Janthinobacterium TaxID=2610881 RepID=UPI001E4C8598|nr:MULTISPECIES: hypothetical protein [unclassified Janthinobacterium]